MSKSNVVSPTHQNDLREFIAAVEQRGELARVANAHWDREFGAVTEVLYRQKVEKAPMLLFDEIPDYPKGYRCAYGMFGSPYRLALVLGMEPSCPTTGRRCSITSAPSSRRASSGFRRRMVPDGPVLENIVRDNEVDMLKLPVPIHHEDDGGRYIGTACGVVTRDPDTGRINVGTYRVQVKGPNTCASYISNGKQGRIHRDKYLKAGKPCPVVIIVGCDPITYLAAGYTMPDSMPEYEWAGGLMDRPLELIEGEVTGLPFPGALRDRARRRDLARRDDARRPVRRMARLLRRRGQGGTGDPHQAHLSPQRSDPDLRGEPEAAALASVRALLPALGGAARCARRRRHPGREGRWLHQAGAGRTFCVVSVKQRYFGHSTQVGLVASQVASVGYISRWIVVVDDDIDPTDIHDVIWAMGTRCDPKTRTTMLDHCWSSRLDTHGDRLFAAL